MRVWTALMLVCLAGCSWFGARKPPAPRPSEYIVTGAPADSEILLDGSPQGAPVVQGRPQIMPAPVGYHVIEVRVGEAITYREQTYLAAGEHHFVQVLTSTD